MCGHSFPHYFEQNTDDIADVAPVPPQEDVNNEDENSNEILCACV